MREREAISSDATRHETKGRGGRGNRDRVAIALDVRDASDDCVGGERGVGGDRVVAAGRDRSGTELQEPVCGEAARRAGENDVAGPERRPFDGGDVNVLAVANGGVHAVAARLKADGDATAEEIDDRALEQRHAAASNASRTKPTALGSLTKEKAATGTSRTISASVPTTALMALWTLPVLPLVEKRH